MNERVLAANKFIDKFEDIIPGNDSSDCGERWKQQASDEQFFSKIQLTEIKSMQTLRA